MYSYELLDIQIESGYDSLALKIGMDRRIIIILGPPGSGKSVIGDTLEYHNWDVRDVGSIEEIHQAIEETKETDEDEGSDLYMSTNLTEVPGIKGVEYFFIYRGDDYPEEYKKYIWDWNPIIISNNSTENTLVEKFKDVLLNRHYRSWRGVFSVDCKTCSIEERFV